jgi:Fur family peroxide stress response transcriptional regulator
LGRSGLTFRSGCNKCAIAKHSQQYGWFLGEEAAIKLGHANKQDKLQRLQTLCRQRGLPLTVHRRAIFEALLERDDHPTVDQVFAEIKDRIPGVSRTTVYRTLETLVKFGLAKKTNHFEAAARFDANTDHHHHLVCIRCGTTVDFDHPGLDKLPLPDGRRTGFEILDFSVYFEGVCEACKRAKANPQGARRTEIKSTNRQTRRKGGNYAKYKGPEES